MNVNFPQFVCVIINDKLSFDNYITFMKRNILRYRHTNNSTNILLVNLQNTFVYPYFIYTYERYPPIETIY